MYVWLILILLHVWFSTLMKWDTFPTWRSELTWRVDSLPVTEVSFLTTLHHRDQPILHLSTHFRSFHSLFNLYDLLGRTAFFRSLSQLIWRPGTLLIQRLWSLDNVSRRSLITKIHLSACYSFLFWSVQASSITREELSSPTMIYS